MTVFFDQGRGQTVGGTKKIITESPLHAQAAVVGRILICPGDLDDPVVFYMQIKLAADAAVATGRAHFGGFPGPHPVARIFFDQSAHRTSLHAFPAKHAIGVFIRPVSGGDDFCAGAPVPIRSASA